MNLFFATKKNSSLSDDLSLTLQRVKEALLSNYSIKETFDPEVADAIILQEQNSFKNFNYVELMMRDELLSKYAHKVFTINDDDCATGLLRGLYTSLPRFRFNPSLHVAVPYMHYPNEYVFSNFGDQIKPCYLASWRGNTKSNSIRRKLVNQLDLKAGILLEQTDSWLNHDSLEKIAYVTVIKNAKFSLCPAGWAPVSFRIYESMALGRCPVIIADQYVRPIGPSWNKCALFFRERDLDCLDSFLRINESDYEKLGSNAFVEWERHFSPNKIAGYYANSLYTLIANSQNLNLEKEMHRWKSLQVFWNNNWTLPQRMINKAKRIMVKQYA